MDSRARKSRMGWDLREASAVTPVRFWGFQRTSLSGREIGELFPEFCVRVQSLTVVPPLARRLGRAAEMFYPALARVEPLRTHLVGVLTRRGTG